MRMDERNTMRLKSEPYDIAILSYARHQLPLLEESISPWESMIYESTSNQKMRMDERNAMLKIRALWHRNSELCPPPAPPVRGEHISLGKHVIGVNFPSKDAYGREEHDAHKI